MHDTERGRQLHICMLCVSLLSLTQQQWIFTCLLTRLIGFTPCGSVQACTEFQFYKEQDLSINKKKHVKAFDID